MIANVDYRDVLVQIVNNLRWQLAVAECDINARDKPEHYINLRLKNGQRFRIEVTEVTNRPAVPEGVTP